MSNSRFPITGHIGHLRKLKMNIRETIRKAKILKEKIEQLENDTTGYTPPPTQKVVVDDQTGQSSKKAYGMYSEILQDIFWLVTNTDDEKRLRAQGITAAIYTNQDILELGKVPKENLPEVLKAVHMAKKEFHWITVKEIRDTTH